MQTCARGCKCIVQHIKEIFLWGNIKCPQMGKQNLQAKKVYSPYVNAYKKRTLILVQYPLVTRLKLIATKKEVKLQRGLEYRSSTRGK